MITYMTGVVYRMPVDSPKLVLLTSAGVGYEITLPAFVQHALQAEGVSEGSDVSFEIYYHVTDRQPRPVLVGFQDVTQKRFFEQLIGVEGVGPSKAAAALVFPVGDIARAIEDEDVTLLLKMPGIGKRAAQKIVASLNGKVTEWALQVDSDSGQPEPAPVDSAEEKVKTEALDVLVSLGHRPADAKKSVEDAIERDPDLAADSEQLIREVFRSLVGVS